MSYLLKNVEHTMIHITMTDLQALLYLARDYGQTEMCVLHSDNLEELHNFNIEVSEIYTRLLERLEQLGVANIVAEFDTPLLVKLAQQRLIKKLGKS